MTNAEGIDVSVYNGSVAAIVPGLDFVIARASIGASVDGRYHDHAASTLHSGKVLGAYHFAVYGPGPTRQARTFLDVATRAAFLAVDDEGVALTHPETVRGIIANLHKLDPQRRHVGLYSSDGTWPGDLGQDFDWVASWGQPPGRPWRFWQYSGTKLDRDQYQGDVVALRTWSKTRRAAQ
jgi:GH25 family lysozyme M1 (1,4-beta-N-acetylmuramidase)